MSCRCSSLRKPGPNRFGQPVWSCVGLWDIRGYSPFAANTESVSVENTYAEDLPDLESCQRKIPDLLESLQHRLQRLDDDYRIHNCFLKMKFYDFNQTTVERQQTEPSYDDYAMLCEEAWQRGRVPVRLLGIGVRLIDLTDGSGQMDLFEN